MLARIGWAAIILLSIFLYALTVPARIDNSHHFIMEDFIVQGDVGLSVTAVNLYLTAISIIGFIVFAGTAIILFRQRSDDWMVMIVSVMLATSGATAVTEPGFYLVDQSLLEQYVEPLLSTITFITLIYFVYTLPDGRFKPRWVAIPAGLAMLFRVATTLFTEQMFKVISDAVWFMVTVVFLALAAVLASYRLKHGATQAQQQQFKWIVIGFIASLVGSVIALSPPLFYPSLSEPRLAAVVFDLVGQSLYILALSMIPVTIAFSVLRYRLWEVDFLINRSAVYGLLTALLVIFTLIELFIFQKIFVAITGQDQSPIVLAIAALISGAIFQPARRRLQRFVDKQFFGIQIDYSQKPRGVLPAAAFQQELTGQTLGAYEVCERIGRGGMAEVFKGYTPD